MSELEKLVVEALERVGYCSCDPASSEYDESGTCWYHLTDDERATRLRAEVRFLLEMREMAATDAEIITAVKGVL